MFDVSVCMYILFYFNDWAQSSNELTSYISVRIDFVDLDILGLTAEQEVGHTNNANEHFGV